MRRLIVIAAILASLGLTLAGALSTIGEQIGVVSVSITRRFDAIE